MLNEVVKKAPPLRAGKAVVLDVAYIRSIWNLKEISKQGRFGSLGSLGLSARVVPSDRVQPNWIWTEIRVRKLIEFHMSQADGQKSYVIRELEKHLIPDVHANRHLWMHRLELSGDKGFEHINKTCASFFPRSKKRSISSPMRCQWGEKLQKVKSLVD